MEGLGILAVLVAGALADRSSAAAGGGSEPLDIDPDPVDFGELDVDDVAETIVSVRDDADGDVPQRVIAIRLVTDSAAFALTEDSCSGTSIRSEGSCQLTVVFAPSAEGDFTATLVVETDIGTSAADVVGSATFAATGTDPAASEPSTETPDGGDSSDVPDDTAQVLPTVAASSTIAPPASTVTPTTGPDVVATDEELLRACDRRAERAEVTFHDELSMTVGQRTSFGVTAAVVDAAASGPTTSLEDPTVTVDPVRLRCEVTALLRGTDFEIEPEGAQPGSFLDQDVIEWSWDVVPETAGTSQLTLDIRSVAVFGGRRLEGAGSRLYVAQIAVAAEDKDLGDSIRQWGTNVVEFPLVQGFGALAAVAAALAAVWRWLLRRPWPWRPQRARRRPRRRKPSSTPR